MDRQKRVTGGHPKALPMAWVQEVTTQPWGHRAFYVRDPDGNVLNVHTVVEDQNG